MSFRNFGLIISAFVVALSFTPAAFAQGDGGGEECTCEPEPTKGNNGLGNGDQTAPGKSLNKNKAENQVGAPGTPVWQRSGSPTELQETLIGVSI
jgi:hypothetical protein